MHGRFDLSVVHPSMIVSLDAVEDGMVLASDVRNLHGQVLLRSGCVLRQGPVLAATAFLIDAPLLKQAALQVLRQNPLYFVDRE